jgi:hypothetical protein
MTERNPKLLIRVPPDMREWLEAQAKRNASNMLAEVVRSVRARMDAEQARAA